MFWHTGIYMNILKIYFIVFSFSYKVMIIIHFLKDTILSL